MTEPTNKDRAERAIKAVEAYEKASGDGNDCDIGLYETPMADLLADLRHACDSLGLPFHELDQRAYKNYLAELGEERRTK